MVIDYNQAAQVARVAGFSLYDTCNCGGRLQHKWRKEGLQLRIFPNQKQYIIESTITGVQTFTGDYSNLEAKLNETI